MKNFINYLKRVFRVIFNIKEPEQKVIEPQKPTLEYIKQLIDKTAVKEKSQDIIDKEFIANRKAINEYKENYRNFIGYKKPPEPLKSLIEADNKLDVTELNIEQKKFIEENKVKYDGIRESEELYKEELYKELYKEEIERERLDSKLMERDGTYNEDFEVNKMALGKIINENHELMGVISNMDKKVVKEKRKGFLVEIEKLNEQCEANIDNPMEDLINSGKEALEKIRIAEEENRIRKI